MRRLTGYKRKDGRFGIRNHLLIIPTVVCANLVVEALVRKYGEQVVGVTHPYGCTFDDVSNTEITETLAGFAANPNVGAVLVVGLGCETVDLNQVLDGIRLHNDLVGFVKIQEGGGPAKAIERGSEIIESFLNELKMMEREPMPFDKLYIGLECGASDSYSGLTANPALGLAVDSVVELGGSAILTELTEFIGAEEEMLARCERDEDRQKLLAYLAETETNLARVTSGNLHDIAPGNIAGGLTTLEEKSLGCVKKGGSSPVVEVVGHGQQPTRTGLIIMDAPGHDIESIIAMAAGGSQVCFFTTGRGSPTGCSILPVIKVSSNSEIAEYMPDIIDINAGTILEDKETLEDVAKRMVDFTCDVVNGKLTKSELNHCREFAIRRRGTGVCIL